MPFDKIVVRNTQNSTVQELGAITALNIDKELKALKQFVDENGGIAKCPDISKIYNRLSSLKDKQDPRNEIRQFLAERTDTLNKKGYTADPYSAANLVCARLALGLVEPSQPYAGQQFWLALIPSIFSGASKKVVRVIFAESLDDYPTYGEALLGEEGSNGAVTYLIHYKLARQKMIEVGWDALQPPAQPAAKNKAVFEVRGTAPNDYFVLSKKYLSEDEWRRVTTFDEQDSQIWRDARDTTKPIQVLKNINNYYEFFEKMRNVFNRYRMANTFQNTTTETEVTTDAQMSFSPFKDVMSSEGYRDFHRYLQKQHKAIRDDGLKSALKLIIELREIYTRADKAGSQQVSTELNTNADYASCFQRNALLLKSSLQAIRPQNFPVEDCVLGIAFPFPWPLPANIVGKDDIQTVDSTQVSSVQDLQVLQDLINADEKIIAKAVQRYRVLFTNYKDFSNFIYGMNNNRRKIFVQTFFDAFPFPVSKESSSLGDAIWACNAFQYAGGVETDESKRKILSGYFKEKENTTSDDLDSLMSQPIAFSLNSRIMVRIPGEQVNNILASFNQSKLERLGRIIKFDIISGFTLKIPYSVFTFSLLVKLLPRCVKYKLQNEEAGDIFLDSMKKDDVIPLMEMFITEKNRDQSDENALFEVINLIQSKTSHKDELDKQLAHLCDQGTRFSSLIQLVLQENPCNFMKYIRNMKRWIGIFDRYVEGGFRSTLLKLHPEVRAMKTMSCVDEGLFSGVHEGKAIFTQKECYDLVSEMLSSSRLAHVSMRYEKIISLSLGFPPEQNEEIQKLMFNQMSSNVKTIDDFEKHLRLLANVSERQLVISGLLKHNPQWFLERASNSSTSDDLIIERLFLLPAVLIQDKEIAEALGSIWNRFSTICIVDLVGRHREPGRRPMSSVKDVSGYYVANSNKAIWRLAFIEDETEREKAFIQEFALYFDSENSFKSMHNVCLTYGVVLTDAFPVLSARFERFKKIHGCLRHFGCRSNPDFSTFSFDDWIVFHGNSRVESDAWELALVASTSDREKEDFAFKLVEKAFGILIQSDISSFFNRNKSIFIKIDVTEDHFVRGYLRSLMSKNRETFNLSDFIVIHRSHPDIYLPRKLDILPDDFFLLGHTLSFMDQFDTKADRLCVLQRHSLNQRSLRRFKDVLRFLVSCSMLGNIRYRTQLQTVAALKECSDLTDLDSTLLRDPLLNNTWSLSTGNNISNITHEGWTMLPWFSQTFDNKKELTNKVFDTFYQTEPIVFTQTQESFSPAYIQEETKTQTENKNFKMKLYSGMLIGAVVGLAVMAFFYQNVLALAKTQEVALSDDAIISLSFVMSAISGLLLLGTVGLVAQKYVMRATPVASETTTTNKCSIM